MELREVIEAFNARFPDISDADLLGFLHPMKDRLLKSEVLSDQARSNSFEQFQLGEFGNLATDALLDSHDTQKKIADLLLQDRTVREQLFRVVAKAVYGAFAAANPGRATALVEK